MNKPMTLRKLFPVCLERVQITGGFWERILRVNREKTLPVEYQRCKETGRIDAFRLAWKPGKPKAPHLFWDSDVAKWIEAASYSIATDPDPLLEKQLNQVVGWIASAQQDDGYLNVYFTVVEPERRWSNLRDQHELYCAGHLMEAAVAHYEATGQRTLLDALCRYADHIDSVFGRGRGKKRGYPGHEEIELALVKLYRVTGRKNYLHLAKYFVDERGRKPHYFDKEAKERGEKPNRNKHPRYDYCQAHLPVRKQRSAEGHAVRACYLYAGMADVAAETADRELWVACRAIWRNLVGQRMYIHGGIGSSRFGERFTLNYDLPNEEAYAETCAAIALVFFAHRMLRIDPDRAYADVMERALFNGILSGVSRDGKRFFYANYLASLPGLHAFTGQQSPVRQPWFGCACCPTNLARLLASLGNYVYAQMDTEIFVHLFVNSRATIPVGGQDVDLIQTTQYPWSENVHIEISPGSPSTFTVARRIPGWCTDARVAVNGDPVEVPPGLHKGYLRLRRKWRPGDRIALRLPMPVARIEAHPSVRHNCGRIALQRGPVLYCLEEKDHGKNLHDIVLPRSAALAVVKGSSGLFGGIPLIKGPAFRRDVRAWTGSLYQTSPSPFRPCEIVAIPYFMWAHRGEGEMLVWIREAEPSVPAEAGQRT